MNKQTIQLSNITEEKELSMQIAAQCAPLLIGLKMSNLLITSTTNKEKVYEIFKHTEIIVECLYVEEDRITFYLYREEQLLDYLHQPDIVEFMNSFGYNDIEIQYILQNFRERFLLYMKTKREFPHEMGILLGYPKKDVEGFIENQGNNFMHIGYWKVYGNLKQAMATFETYNYAKRLVIQLVSHGVSIEGILNVYHNKNNKEICFV